MICIWILQWIRENSSDFVINQEQERAIERSSVTSKQASVLTSLMILKWCEVRLCPLYSSWSSMWIGKLEKRGQLQMNITKHLESAILESLRTCVFILERTF
jgi:hypothetical protein